MMNIVIEKQILIVYINIDNKKHKFLLLIIEENNKKKER